MSTNETEITTKPAGRNWLLLGGGLVVLIIVTLIFVYGLNPINSNQELPAQADTAGSAATTSQIDFPETGPPLQVGDVIYNFNLADLEGGQVSLQEFAGSPLIINYWATWCGPCRIEMPHLQNTFETYKDDGLVVLALDQDETTTEVKDFFDEFGLTFTPLMDDGKATSENYGVGRILPTSFFVNEEGKITAIHRGPMTQGQIDGYLAETLP